MTAPGDPSHMTDNELGITIIASAEEIRAENRLLIRTGAAVFVMLVLVVASLAWLLSRPTVTEPAEQTPAQIFFSHPATPITQMYPHS